MKKVLSIDIGASSGRFIVVSYDNGVFNHEEVYRFPNGMIEEDGHLRWNFNQIKKYLDEGLIKTFSLHPDIKSIGVDTWAVDYGILNKENELDENPIGYRDYRNDEAANRLLSKVSYQEIYNESGIQFLPFNTIFQLYDDLEKRMVDKFLLIPDLINYYLTGNRFIELTNASTTALYNPLTKKWSEKNLNLIGLNTTQMPSLIYPSKKVGVLSSSIVKRLNIPSVDVISVGSHDTASAVAAIQLDNNSAYLSSGTWSLLGVELDKPIITEESYKANFTNEIGLEHTVRFLKNIMGLFIIQEIKKDIDKQKEYSFQQLQDEAKKVNDNHIYIDVQDDLFQRPGNMLNKYYEYLKKTKQYQDNLSVGQIIRSIYESMAFKYIEEFNNLKKITAKPLNKIVVIGGGMKAKLLNQLIADCLNVIVKTGESESTVYGNALAQFIYLNEFDSLNTAREALKAHTNSETYMPQEVEKYQRKYVEYLKVIGRKD